MKRSGALKRSFILLSLSCTPFESGGDRLPDAAAPEPEWQCLRAPPELPPPVAAEGRVTYAVPIVDFDSQQGAPAAVPGLQLTVCNGAPCDPPAPPCAGVLTPDCVDIRQMEDAPPFLYTLSFPRGFEAAILRLQAPRYASVDYVLGGPMVGSPDGAAVVTGYAIAMPLWTTAERISLEMGSPPSPEQHALLLRVLDCNGERAAGVTVQTLESAPGGIPFTLSGASPTRQETLVTGARGVAGFIGLPSPTIDVIGVSPSGVELGGPTKLDLRAGVITVAELRYGLGVWGQ